MVATRSRLVALGLSVGAAAGLVAGMVATAKPQAQPVAVAPDPAIDEPVAAEPPDVPIADRPSITGSSAS